VASKTQGPVRNGLAPGLIRKRFGLVLEVDGSNESARMVDGRTPRRSQNELAMGLQPAALTVNAALAVPPGSPRPRQTPAASFPPNRKRLGHNSKALSKTRLRGISDLE
jgi:hypothetical protein